MYMCERCGEAIEALPVYREDYGEVLTSRDCPFCHGYESLEEAVECERCGELVFKYDSFVDNKLQRSCLNCAELGEPDYDKRLRKKGILHYDSLRIDLGLSQPCGSY